VKERKGTEAGSIDSSDSQFRHHIMGHFATMRTLRCIRIPAIALVMLQTLLLPFNTDLVRARDLVDVKTSGSVAHPSTPPIVTTSRYLLEDEASDLEEQIELEQDLSQTGPSDVDVVLEGATVRQQEPEYRINTAEPTVVDTKEPLLMHREVRNETIAFDDFEQGNNHSWTDQRVSQSEFFTSFLGRFGQAKDGSNAFTQTSKAYHVPPEAGHVEITFDFFEIDLWCHCDHLSIMVCNQTVDMGEFSQSGASNQSGVTNAGIEWWRRAQIRNTDLGYSRYRDGVHRMGLTIPQACYAPGGGLLELKFNLTIDGDYELASGGKRYHLFITSSRFGCDSLTKSQRCFAWMQGSTISMSPHMTSPWRKASLHQWCLRLCYPRQ
jgi:hypothetical protein